MLLQCVVRMEGERVVLGSPSPSRSTRPAGSAIGRGSGFDARQEHPEAQGPCLAHRTRLRLVIQLL